MGPPGTLSPTELAMVLGTFSGVSRPCNGGLGKETFDGSAWGPCLSSASYCGVSTRPGCSATSAAASCKALLANPLFAGGDGRYFLNTGTGPFEAWCDMTTQGGGWTRVFVVNAPASSGCLLGTGALGDPSVGMACAKYADSVINALATERIFYTRIGDNPPLFTRYTGVISSATNASTTIGNVVNKETYAAVVAATPAVAPAYTGFRLFSQHNWYQADTQLGSAPRSCRLSLEYLDTNSVKYACCGASCEIASPPRIDYGLIVAYVK